MVFGVTSNAELCSITCCQNSVTQDSRDSDSLVWSQVGGTTRAEVAQGTPTQRHLSPSAYKYSTRIGRYEENQGELGRKLGNLRKEL